MRERKFGLFGLFGNNCKKDSVLHQAGFNVQSSGFRVEGSRFGVWGLKGET